MINLQTYEEFLNEAGSGDIFNPKRGVPLKLEFTFTFTEFLEFPEFTFPDYFFDRN